VKVHGTFHYTVPDAWPELRTGERVRVPFGARQATAIVIDPAATAPSDRSLKPALERLDPELDAPLVPPDVLDLARFASRYYVAPLGDVLRVALPPALTTASVDRYQPTEAGRAALDAERTHGMVGVAVEGTELEALRRCASTRGGARLTARAARRLVHLGLVERARSFDIRHLDDGRPRVVRRRASVAEAWPHIRRSRLKRDLFDFVGEGAPTLDAIRQRFGPRSATALRALEDLGLVAIERGDWPTDPIGDGFAPNPGQARALAEIQASIGEAAGRGFLLQGVTGSGKTEVYLRAVTACLARGLGALIMVPEIGLTPQLESRFRERFGERVVTLHSGLGPRERVRRWSDLWAGRRTVVLGPRSAVWAPVRDLGLVVVDEEHDGSYKQNADVRYHGRDLALVRAHRRRATLVLGSATPSLESHRLSHEGRLERLRLPQRATGAALPKVTVADLRDQRRDELFTPLLRRRLADTVAAGQQAILFLNRRGFNTFVVCGGCQQPLGCPSCDVSLTFHREAQRLRCHHCGYSASIRAPCPHCGAQTPEPFGTGTERLEEALLDVVPQARILRLDRDSATTALQVQEKLTSFGAGEADILVGTKMVTKGHDFPGVTLVGILMADASFAFPDFRAHEHTFHLLTQTAGRAGRRNTPGEVLIQTLQPDHPVIRLATRHDVDGFLEFETAQRRAAGLPPWGRFAMVRCEGRDPDATEAHCIELANQARARNLTVLGPTEAPIGKVKNRYRFRFLLKGESPAPLLAVLHPLVRRPARGIDVIVDVDPTDFL
jgi:primosomal protein N' (replication factor Y)